MSVCAIDLLYKEVTLYEDGMVVRGLHLLLDGAGANTSWTSSTRIFHHEAQDPRVMQSTVIFKFSICK